MAILIGFVFLFCGYIAGVKIIPLRKDQFLVTDWSTGWTVLVGLSCIALGLYATWGFQVSSHGGVASTKVSSLVVTIQVLARMLEPVGAVLLSYAYLKTRSFSLFVLVVAIAAAKLPLGIILNSKEIGISFIAIFVMTKWIYDGRLPYRWIVTFMIIITLYFPFSYAYRATLVIGNSLLPSRLKRPMNIWIKPPRRMKEMGELFPECSRLRQGLI